MKTRAKKWQFVPKLKNFKKILNRWSKAIHEKDKKTGTRKSVKSS